MGILDAKRASASFHCSPCTVGVQIICNVCTSFQVFSLIGVLNNASMACLADVTAEPFGARTFGKFITIAHDVPWTCQACLANQALPSLQLGYAKSPSLLDRRQARRRH